MGLNVTNSMVGHNTPKGGLVLGKATYPLLQKRPKASEVVLWTAEYLPLPKRLCAGRRDQEARWGEGAEVGS